MRFLEGLESLYKEFIFRTNMQEEYAYRLSQVKDFYLSLSDEEKVELDHNILAITVLNINTEIMAKSLIDFLYYIGEEDIAISDLSQEYSYVIATSLTMFAKVASEEKRSLWISPRLVNGLISITTDLDDAVDCVIEFQNRTIRKRLPNELRETLDDFVILSDEEIELEAEKFIEEKRGLRRSRLSGKNN